MPAKFLTQVLDWYEKEYKKTAPTQLQPQQDYSGSLTKRSDKEALQISKDILNLSVQRIKTSTHGNLLKQAKSDWDKADSLEDLRNILTALYLVIQATNSKHVRPALYELCQFIVQNKVLGNVCTFDATSHDSELILSFSSVQAALDANNPIRAYLEGDKSYINIAAKESAALFGRRTVPVWGEGKPALVTSMPFQLNFQNRDQVKKCVDDYLNACIAKYPKAKNIVYLYDCAKKAVSEAYNRSLMNPENFLADIKLIFAALDHAGKKAGMPDDLSSNAKAMRYFLEGNNKIQVGQLYRNHTPAGEASSDRVTLPEASEEVKVMAYHMSLLSLQKAGKLTDQVATDESIAINEKILMILGRYRGGSHVPVIQALQGEATKLGQQGIRELGYGLPVNSAAFVEAALGYFVIERNSEDIGHKLMALAIQQHDGFRRIEYGEELSLWKMAEKRAEVLGNTNVVECQKQLSEVAQHRSGLDSVRHRLGGLLARFGGTPPLVQEARATGGGSAGFSAGKK